MNSAFKAIIVIPFFANLVLQTLTLSGQVRTEDLEDRFERHVSVVHQEKVYVHTDKPVYIAGETIWMSAYSVDAMFHIPNGLSRVLNIELLDNAGQAVEQVRVKMTKGFGNGQIFVSPDIPSGYYTLRAYTNWMKNFDADYAFQKSIGIVNPSTFPSDDALSNVGDSAFVQFFPEGGDLVYGLKSKVAVKILDEYGTGLALSGLVFDNDDNEVAKFTTSRFGFASFELIPETGKTYNARVAIDSLLQKYNLPQAEESGVVITVITNKDGDFDLNIESQKTVQSTFYVVMHTRGKIIKIMPLNIVRGQNIALPAKDMTPGITHITVMDDLFQPIAERLIFKYPAEHNPISLNLPKKKYGKRENVLLSLNSNDLESREDIGQLSISVFRTSEHVPSSENIVSNLLLTSDIKGKVENADVYFDAKNNNRAKQIDLLLLTQGWRRFDWKNIIREKNFQIQYPVELNGPILSGLLSNNDEKKRPKSLLINFIGKTSVMNSFDVGKDGIFHFEVPFRVRNDRVHFFSLYDNLVSEQITVYSPFDLKPKNEKEYPMTFHPKSRDFLEALNTNIQVAQVYREFNYVNGNMPMIDELETNFFGKPDYLYLLDDYTRFETVQDLFLEYIRSAIIKNNNRQDGFYVVKDNKMFPAKALTTIDGIPVIDTETMLNFDPLKIKKIEIVDDYYFIGSTKFNGIVNFSTYNGDFGQRELPELMIEKAYHSLQRNREFYSPDYQIEKIRLNRIPDYRNTLYWNQSVMLKKDEIKELEFFTSDDTGTYQIEINGVTNTGRPFYFTEQIYVKDNLN